MGQKSESLKTSESKEPPSSSFPPLLVNYLGRVLAKAEKTNLKLPNTL